MFCRPTLKSLFEVPPPFAWLCCIIVDSFLINLSQTLRHTNTTIIIIGT